MKDSGFADVPVDLIEVAGRVRRDYGDIEALASDIEEIGLLQPIVITPERRLISGERRLLAFKHLGRATIPAHVVTNLTSPLSLIKAEKSENDHHKPFTWSEKVEMAARLEPLEQEAAKKRMLAGRPSENLSQGTGRALDKVATALDTSRTSLVKARRVIEKAEEDPAMFGEFATLMDTKGSVDMAYQQMRQRESEIGRSERTKQAAQVESIGGAQQRGPLKVETDQWFQLGRHLLYCGDTSNPEFHANLPTADLAFADPPYNAGSAAWDTGFQWRHDWLIDHAEIVAVTPGIASLFQFYNITKMPYRWSIACWITNGMTRGALGFSNWIYVALFSNESPYYPPQDHLKVSISNATTGETDHKGRKPAELILWLLDTFTEENEVVIDPFLGSGTTLLCAEKSNRVCIGGEINPEYCQDIIRRWEAQTGLKAQRSK